MTRKWILIVCLVAQFLANTVLGADQQIIQVRVIGNSNFEVLYDRAQSNGTGGALFGLLGAGIQAGIESGRDQSKRDAMQKQISSSGWQDVFVKSFNETLAEKNFTANWTNDETPAPASVYAYLTLRPKLHGFKMVDTSTQLVSAFVEFEANYSHDSFNKNNQKENVYLTSSKQAPYETWLNDASTMNSETEALFARAGRRLANKLIYNFK